MTSEQEPSTQSRSDHRSRLYRRYVTLQVGQTRDELHTAMNEPQPHLERLIAKYMPPDRDSRILDAGCGYGQFLHALRKMGYRQARGVETSEEQVEMARQLGLMDVRKGDLLQELRGAAGFYDAIIAFDVLEHFTKDEVLDVLSAAYAALKPGGKLILHVPNGEAIFAGKIFFGDFTHQVAFTAKSIRQVALYAGFTDIQCYEDKPVVHGPVSGMRAMLWWLVRTKFRILNMIETGDPGGSLILSQNLLAVCRK